MITQSSLKPVVQLENAIKDYGKTGHCVRALQDISLTISAGEFVAIIGASGSGKSTLLNILGMLDQLSSGTYALDGKDVSKISEKQSARLRNAQIGFVFQQFNLMPTKTALENVLLPTRYSKKKTKNARERAKILLDQVGLTDRMQHTPNEMSGGQQQRVAIARALMTEPTLLLADEPTGNLDSHTTEAILDLFNLIHRNGTTIAMVTHDDNVAHHASRILTMKDGHIINDTRNTPAKTNEATV